MGFRKKMEWWYTSIFCCNIHFLKKINQTPGGDTGTPLTKLSRKLLKTHRPTGPSWRDLHRSLPNFTGFVGLVFCFFEVDLQDSEKYGKGGKELEKRRWALFLYLVLDFWKGTYRFYITAHEYDISLSLQFATLDYRSKHTLQHDNEQLETLDFRWKMSFRNPGSYQWQW